MALRKRQTDLHDSNNFLTSIDKVSFKRNSMSLGLVVLEEKLFTQTWAPQEIVFNTMRYRSSETVQRSGYFQSNVSYKKLQIIFLSIETSM